MRSVSEQQKLGTLNIFILLLGRITLWVHKPEKAKKDSVQRLLKELECKPLPFELSSYPIKEPKLVR